MNKPEIIGIILIIFGILGIIGTGYSYTLGTAADAQKVLQDSGAIIERHEEAVSGQPANQLRESDILCSR